MKKHSEFLFESGEATLILGGTMVGPKTMKPHEIRGTSIEGEPHSSFSLAILCTFRSLRPTS